jgi:hypothetical protein
MWVNLVKIVEALRGHDHPGYVLAVVVVMAAVALGIVGITSAAGSAGLSEVLKLLR